MQPETSSLRGRLLIASPALLDPNFRRTVVLVTEHTDEGAMGLILSRPSGIAVDDAVPELADLVAADERVFAGGPVEPSAVLVLAELEEASDAATLVFDAVGFLPAGEDRPELRRARVFAGYAGWGPGQLEAELEHEAWIVEQPRPDDVFGDAPGELWSAVLRRKGGQFALISRMPVDPSLN